MWSASTNHENRLGSRPSFGTWLLAPIAGLIFSCPVHAQPEVSRVWLIERQMERQHQVALDAVEQALREDSEVAQRLGFDYLRGHLLLVLDRQREALQAFATTMGATPKLEHHSRLRLAVEQEKLEHPEVAAGLVATLLGSAPPASLTHQAMRLLERTIQKGGDCRLLQGLEQRRWKRPERRLLDSARAECLRRGGDREKHRKLLLDLLEESTEDDVALGAARHLAEDWATRAGGNAAEEMPTRVHFLIGMTFHAHREFDPAIGHLAQVLVQLPTATDLSDREAFQGRYALARSHFWNERFDEAAAAFEALAQTPLTATRRAQTLYQQARSYELGNRWELAIRAFEKAYRTEPRGRWSDASLIAQTRLRWLRNDREGALEAFDELVATRKLTTTSRAALFLASSELVTGNTEQVAGWLDMAWRLGKVPRQEHAYWSARLAENEGRLRDAADLYLRALRENPYHPLGEATRGRLADPVMQPIAQQRVRRLLDSQKIDELYSAWLALDSAPGLKRRAEEAISRKLSGDPRVEPFLTLDRPPADQWPMWRKPLDRPEEILLALGLFDEAAPVVLRHFPVADPSLAFTGSMMLAQSGEIRRSLYIAEIMAKRIPGHAPPQFLPPAYRQLLFPFGYSYLILREAGERQIDPYLLAGLIREESRFDPQAFSAASARGLTQFVLSTARRVADRIDLGPIEPQDLENPEISIALGAAYLQELFDHFDGKAPLAIAAYNAGEPQSELWSRYCLSDDPAELLTKIAFRETRSYVARVLTSRAHYRELYLLPGKAEAATADSPRTSKIP